MVTRILPVGMAVGLASLFSVGLSPLSAAQAAYPAWSAYTSQAKRPQFRPWHRGERQRPATRWRPLAAAPTFRTAPAAESTRRPVGAAAGRARAPVVSGGTARRYVAPKMPIQQPGVRFRPDERQGPATDREGMREPANDWGGAAIGAQFRPAERRRKPAYEQMQARGAAPAVAPGAPFAAYGAPPLSIPPMYGAYWPRW